MLSISQILTHDISPSILFLPLVLYKSIVAPYLTCPLTHRYKLFFPLDDPSLSDFSAHNDPPPLIMLYLGVKLMSIDSYEHSSSTHIMIVVDLAGEGVEEFIETQGVFRAECYACNYGSSV
jgi:hypothetical protein